MTWGGAFFWLFKSIRNVQVWYGSDRNINYESQRASVENSTEEQPLKTFLKLPAIGGAGKRSLLIVLAGV